jgi:hypothetical protein
MYTPELGAAIAERLAWGESLRTIAEADGMPTPTTMIRWALNPEHPFCSQYAEANRLKAENIASELVEIADNGKNDWIKRNDPENPGYVANGEHIQRSRLRLDTRKWYLSKLLPKVYGDRLEIKQDVTVRDETADQLAGEAASLGLDPETLFGRQRLN